MRKIFLFIPLCLIIGTILCGDFFISQSGVTDACLNAGGVEIDPESPPDFYFVVRHDENSANCCNHSVGTVTVYYKWFVWIDDDKEWKACSVWLSENLVEDVRLGTGCMHGGLISSRKTPIDTSYCNVQVRFYYECDEDEDCVLGDETNYLWFEWSKDNLTEECEDCP